MRKKKKQKKTKEKILENPSEKFSVQQSEDSDANLLEQKVKTACDGLFYVSETNAEISFFAGSRIAAVTMDEVLSQIKNTSDAPVEEKNFDEFFAPLTEIQDWFGDEEKKTAQKFADLRDLLKNNLKELKIFKIGKIELNVYVVGLDAESKLTGIKTKAVET